MNITFQGNPVTIKHEAVKENETLKPFTAIRNDMSEWRSEDSTGTRIFLSVYLPWIPVYAVWRSQSLSITQRS